MTHKFAATIRVLLSNDGRKAIPDGNDLCGYYRSVLLFAGDEREARSVLEKSVEKDGEIDWANSELVEVRKTAFDWIRMLGGHRVIRRDGRGFFPFEEQETAEDDSGIIGWRMGKEKNT
jgi:hypothetical protein